MRNKRGGTQSEMIFMIFRVIIISIIGLVILGLNAAYYNNELDIKETESYILNRNIYDCLVHNFNLKEIPLEYKNRILEFCGYEDKYVDRIYVKIEVDGNFEYQQGDSGKMWIYDIAKSGNKYQSKLTVVPGFTEKKYSTRNSEIKIEVLVLDEE